MSFSLPLRYFILVLFYSRIWVGVVYFWYKDSTCAAEAVDLFARGFVVKSFQVGYTQYMGYYSDTDSQMEALQIKLLRQAPPWRKMEMLINLNASARELALAGLRRRYPSSSEKALNRRLADILLGEQLAAKVYGVPTEDAA